MAGATAVQVGTAGLADPRALPSIVDGLAKYLDAEGIRSIAELRGAARR
jgi:dihydroorotate dehydrogenase (NAD+) catalytic subunit